MNEDDRLKYLEELMQPHIPLKEKRYGRRWQKASITIVENIIGNWRLIYAYKSLIAK